MASSAPPTVSFADRNFVLSARAREHEWAGVGTLSIKAFFGGRALYDLGGGRAAVDDGCYLVLNHGQEYRIRLDSRVPVESFCVFFRSGLVEDVRRTLNACADRLLDDPIARAAGPVEFYQRTYPHDDIVSPALLKLHAACARRCHEPGWLDDRMHALAERLLRRHAQVQHEVARLSAVRAATREELYRRLHRARDFMRASLDRPLRLEDSAAVACLSPNHFLRTYRDAFGLTPHQHLIALRLERARELLSGTGRSVTEVCFSVGFESLGSFSTLFRRRFGVPPSRYRLEKG